MTSTTRVIIVCKRSFRPERALNCRGKSSNNPSRRSEVEGELLCGTASGRLVSIMWTIFGSFAGAAIAGLAGGGGLGITMGGPLEIDIGPGAVTTGIEATGFVSAGDAALGNGAA